MGWRIDEEDEVEGIDVNEHAETAYDFVGTGGGSRSLVGAGSSSSAQRKESVDA
jgi:Amt family ammonium transporter